MSDLEPITQEETAWANGDLEPITRKEQYLNRLTGEEQAIPETPITRTEQYLAKLCGMETEIPSSPITREEAYLAYLNGEDVTLPEPITRLEQFMAFAAEKSETKPTPLTREEFYWDKYQGGAVLKDFPGLPASIVTVTDALAKPLDSLKVAITPVQEGSGDPSPENVRPISGWTECNVTRCGVNLFDKDVDISANKYYYNSSGVAVPSKNYRTSKPIAIKPNTSYFWAINGVPPIPGAMHQSPRVVFLDDSGAFISSGNELGNSGSASTSPNNARYMMVPVYTSSPLSVDIAMLTEGDTIPTAYEPYTGQDYSITFPSEAGTVYGGTLDVVNGIVTLTHGFTELSEDWAWRKSSSYQGSYYVDKSATLGYKPFTPIMSSHAKTINNIADYVYGGCLCEGSINFWLMGADSTMRDWKNYIVAQRTAGTPIQIRYKLATPQTFQLTPTEVQMLLGTNNLWADTGDVLEGKYWGKKSSTTRAMLNTLRDAGEITPTEEPEENNER